MNTLQEQLKLYSSLFQVKTRDNGETFVCAPDKPEELQQALYKAHGDRLPSDWIYSTFSSILERMQEYDSNILEDFEEYRGEIVDSLVDTYTHDLTAWLHDHNGNVYYLTEALEEFEPKDGFQALAMAQYQAINEIYSEVYQLLENTKDEQWIEA